MKIEEVRDLMVFLSNDLKNRLGNAMWTVTAIEERVLGSRYRIVHQALCGFEITDYRNQGTEGTVITLLPCLCRESGEPYILVDVDGCRRGAFPVLGGFCISERTKGLSESIYQRVMN